MKKLWQMLSAAVTVCLLLLYASPSIQQLNHMPQAVSEWTPSDGALLSFDGGVAQARGSGDERLAAAEQTYTVSLFGVLPLRTVTVVDAATEVCLGGDAIGIELHTLGVQVVGVGSVMTADGVKSPASAAGLKAGDAILAVDDTPVQDSAHFSALVNGGATPQTLTLLRDGATLRVSVTPAIDRDDGAARIGAWVRDSTSGIGTLSVIDPRTSRYAALGHAVSDVDTGVMFLADTGAITNARITEVRRGAEGAPGELIGVFGQNTTRRIGDIDVNSVFGISGSLYADALLGRPTVPIAKTGEVTQGGATLYATVDERGVQGFSCNVIRLEVQASPMTQGMMVEVTDERLLSATGGIVQGMSGSPIMQNGKLIGVVTHVFVNDPKRGFCLYAEWMAEKLL